MTVRREAKEGIQYQGEDETLAYTITTTPWASSPGNVSAKIFSYDPDTETYTDVTATNMSGSPSVNGDVITLPVVTGLTDGTQYRVEVKFTVSGNIFEPYFWIHAQR